MKPSLEATVSPDPRRRFGTVAAWCAFSVVSAASAAAGEPAATRPAAAAPRRPAIVDHAVAPAGGLLHCRHCGDAGCPHHRGHLAGCRDGLCAPHCPVRPSQYGFYRTQWRRWPGQGVVPVSAEDAATPAVPPASQVPSVEEESPRPAGDDAEAPAPAADRAGADERVPTDPPRADGGLPAEPIPEKPIPNEPAVPRPADPPVPPTPPGEPAVVPGAGDKEGDLFDQSALPIPEDDAPVGAGAMRYPAKVGRSIAAGAAPWRLDSGGTQRAVDSVRGL